MQCCESHGKGVRKSALKKAKYHAGVAVKNCQANCSYSGIHQTLKREKIPILLSAIKRIGQRFETTGNVARKKGSGRPKASSCRDDHLLTFTVLKDRKISLQKLSAEFKTSENKTLSRRAITRRLSNAGFVFRRCHCFLRKTSDRMKLLAEYGNFDSEWFSRVVWSDESIFQLHADLQRGVFEDLVRNTIVNASLTQLSMEEEVSWCGEPFQLLVLVSCFTVKSQLMLWNTG